MGKYSRKYIGQKFKTKESLGGYEVEVIDGGDKMKYCLVRFYEPVEFELEIQVDNLKKGKVKNPYHPSVYGIGYIGIGKHKVSINGKHTKKYTRWVDMHTRSYCQKFHDRQPTYKDVEVCEEWNNFQNFGDWDDKNYIEGYHLDKDILSKDIVFSNSSKLSSFLQSFIQIIA